MRDNIRDPEARGDAMRELRDRAASGSLIVNRLVPAPDRGPGCRRDPETGFVYYSSEWLSDRVEARRLRSVK